ncbi:MAG: ferritin family protein [Deltaproteobacteria bacterium]|nr:ferritin family protein [Deltaproteobacteria bacterium]
MYNLQGGIRAWQGVKVAGPPEMGLEFVKDMETPEAIILFASGMEERLGGFYTEASGKTGDAEAAQLLTKLAGIEEKHKGRLFELFRKITGTHVDRPTFESKIVRGALEGGLSTEEYLERIMGKEHALEDVFSIAMMFEAQAMDLYMRYSEEIKHQDAKKLFHDLAQQEKAHLTALGELMNRKA